MNRLKAIIVLIIFLTTASVSGQDKNENIGIKGGVNYGKYTPSKNNVIINFNSVFILEDSILLK